MRLDVLNLESAPDGERRELEEVRAAYGFIPNLMGVMANAPALLRAYRAVLGLFDQTSLTPAERQVVLLAASAENGCDYCVAAHTVVAGMQKVPGDVVTAIRDGVPIPDGRLEALRALVAELVRTRGWPAPAVTNAFLAAGYAPEQLLEVILGVGLKTLSNYTNHAASTPLDPQFAAAAWRANDR